MKSEWQHKKLGEIGKVVGGATPSTRKVENYQGGLIPWITPKDLSNHHGRYISHGERNITESGLKSCAAKMMPTDSILFSSRAPIGYIAIASNPVCTNQGFKSIVPNEDIFPLFLYYLLVHNREKIKAQGSGTTFMEVSASTMSGVEVAIPSLATQRKIAAILSSLDDKIENNNAICKNLEEQVLTSFREYSWVYPRRQVQMQDVFDITIGKTPPRKEHEWFSTSYLDIPWISISDMGKSGMYISKTSEYLTRAAVNRFNVKIIPAGTIVVSFKLTVGRVGIADKEMATNEAIAHFGKCPVELREYLYCYLKTYEYGKLGNTSSIAVAVNSKTIKAMDFELPNDKELRDFHAKNEPIFEIIRQLQEENMCLSGLRNTLLPMLMSGEIEVDKVAI